MGNNPSISSGDKHWANIDVLVYDASRARNALEEVRNLRRLLWALAKNGPLRVSRLDLDAYDANKHWVATGEDVTTNELVIQRGTS
jgi:hypothetical protein